jgi:hypothetical protein
MNEEIDDQTKLKLYMLIVNRYKGLISDQEEKSVSQIRARISPYNENIKAIRDKLISDISPFEYDLHFFQAATRALHFIRKIKTCKFLLTFWMSYPEIDELGVAGIMDKAILLAALLRSFDSKDAKVIVTKSGRAYVGFSWKGEDYLVVPESGSLLSKGDVSKQFADDLPAYAFSDLFYESYEEA